MGTPAPAAVKRLVDRFDRDRKVFLSGDYKEEQLRLEFLNPFFTALGWDMDNTLDTIRARNWGSVPPFPPFPITGYRRHSYQADDTLAHPTGRELPGMPEYPHYNQGV
jgi:hypothetical protein